MDCIKLLPLEIKYELALYLPSTYRMNEFSVDYYQCLISYLTTYNLLGKEDKDFWVKKACIDFNISIRKYKSLTADDSEASPLEKYLKLLSTIGKGCFKGAEKYLTKGNAIFSAAR